MEGLDWWPQLPEFQTFLDEQTLLPLTSAEEEECDDKVGDTDDEYGVDDAVGDGHGVGDDDESRIVKAGNMRRGDVGDTGVFPREYQSRTSAPPPPENVTSSKKMGHLPAQPKSRKSHLLLECYRRGKLLEK